MEGGLQTVTSLDPHFSLGNRITGISDKAEPWRCKKLVWNMEI